MSIQDALLAHLRDHVPERTALSNHLGGDGRICCYYVCPFSTLRKIVVEGIKCRNSIPQAVDLSSADVQSRRKTVWLGHSDSNGAVRRMRDVPIHSCVNLFWSPLNRTFEAFQRNGLLRAAEAGDAEHGIVCLLELDVERLLNEPEVYWTATNQNAASGGFASFEMNHLRWFPWAKTYTLGPYTPDNPWQPRAAELLVFLGGSGQQHTRPVPRFCFTRAILPTDVQFTRQQEEWLSASGLPFHRANVFKSVPDLLKSERYLVSNLATYRRADIDCVKRVVSALRLVTEFESRFGGPTADRFQSPALAHGPHGVGHVARVMFWAAFLGTYPFGQHGTSKHTAAVLAALLHDLGRRSEGTDEGHGERVLEQHADLVREALPEQELRDSCISAIRMHGIPDDECPAERRDQLWEIVKDADGLERGRFGPPGSEGRGCNPSMLRLGYVSHAKATRRSAPWLAYQLHGITKHSQWDKRPCRRLLTDLFWGVGLGLSRNVYPADDIAVAREFHTELTALHGEVAMQEWCEEMGDLLEQADAAYAEYAERQDEEERLYHEEQKREWEEWLESDDDNDWDDHDINWGDFDRDDD